MHKTLYVKVYTYLIEQLEEARQKNNKILIEHYLYEIQRLQDNGQNTHSHATVYHSLNNFTMYRKYNKQLDIFLGDITQNYSSFDRDAKIKAIQYKIEFLSNKTLMYISEYVNDMFLQESEENTD